MSNYDALFDEQGNCPSLGDPYREQSGETYELLFDERGYLRADAKQELQNLLNKRYRSGKVLRPLCTLVKLILADDFAMNTGGNYSTIYAWR